VIINYTQTTGQNRKESILTV